MEEEIFEYISDYQVKVVWGKKEYCIYDIAEMLTRSSIAMKDMIEIKPMFRVYEALIGKPLIGYTIDNDINRYYITYKLEELLKNREILKEDLVYTDYYINRENLLVEVEELYQDRLGGTEFSYWWLATQLYEDIKHQIYYEEIIEVEKNSEENRHKKGVSYVISLLYLWYGDPRNIDNPIKKIYMEAHEQLWKENKEKLRIDLSLQSEFEQQVRKASRDTKKRRQKRIEGAPKIPDKKVTMKVIYQRNPDVVAEVLERANGICERCGATAPFNRASDGTPYLEVHHKIPLSERGEDTVENSIAVCPNCHRELHYG